jgi:oligopeptide/dipeptide ABC transporter ATP-binding protein
VIYAGHIVEVGRTGDVLLNPQHPYTQALLEAVPRVSRARRQRNRLQGEPADPIHPPTGCPFRTRCPRAMEACAERPAFTEPEPGHFVACWLHERKTDVNNNRVLFQAGL